jgi:signal transduction histidine kinase/CheY-like chemotaxis protein
MLMSSRKPFGTSTSVSRVVDGPGEKMSRADGGSRHKKRMLPSPAGEARLRSRQFAQVFKQFSASASSARKSEEILDACLEAVAGLTGTGAAAAFVGQPDQEIRRAVGEAAALPETASAARDGVETGSQLRLLSMRYEDTEVGLLCWRADDPEDDPDEWMVDVLASRAADAIVQLRARERLEQAIRSRDDALGMVAHDLRNPLGIVMMGASALLQRGGSSYAQRTAERVLRAAQRAVTLVRDLVDVSLIEAGQFRVQTHPLEPARLVLAALDAQQELVGRASIILATDLAPDLPMVEADEERTLEVLDNLIGNAVKFTRVGGTITVGTSAVGEEILFWVRDNGEGISTDHFDHLFDRFWQARKHDRRGAGLGLTICKAIVEAHGGRIWAESQAGQGTTIFFSLPVSATTSVRAPTSDASILIVDDRIENLIALKAILDAPGYRLVTAQSGPEALKLVLREDFSLALLDIAMPGMTGLDVAAHFQELERTRQMPIIFVTAFGDDPEEVRRAYAAGGVDYLVKPLDPDVVRKKVAVFVDLNRHREGSIAVSRTSLAEAALAPTMMRSGPRANGRGRSS